MLNVLEVRKTYQMDISKRCAALQNLSEGDDINRAWKNIEENTENSAKESPGLHELTQHKQRFD